MNYGSVKELFLTTGLLSGLYSCIFLPNKSGQYSRPSKSENFKTGKPFPLEILAQHNLPSPIPSYLALYHN